MLARSTAVNECSFLSSLILRLNSSNVLDTNRWKWSSLKAVGDAPSPRSYHRYFTTFSWVCSRRGGTEKERGNQFTTYSSLPVFSCLSTIPFSATAISSDGSPQGRNQVVVFGGNNGEKCFNGVHVLELMGEGKKWVWSNPKTKGSKFSASNLIKMNPIVSLT